VVSNQTTRLLVTSSDVLFSRHVPESFNISNAWSVTRFVKKKSMEMLYMKSENLLDYVISEINSHI